MPSPLFLNFKDILRISSSCLKLLFSVQVFVQYSSQLKISALSDERSQNWQIHKAGKLLKALLLHRAERCSKLFWLVSVFIPCWTSPGTVLKRRAKRCQTVGHKKCFFLLLADQKLLWGFLSQVKHVERETLLDRLTPKVWLCRPFSLDFFLFLSNSC